MKTPKTELEATALVRLFAVVKENCPRTVSGRFDSMDKPSFADALSLLAEYGYVKIIRDAYGRVQAE